MARPMMTPGGLALAPGTRLPPNWAKPGAVVDAANRIVRPEDLAFRVTKNRDTREHKEKAYAVTTRVGGMGATIVGAGVEWTEDLKDQARRLHEEEVKFARQRRAQEAERAAAKMQAWKDHIDRKIAAFKRNSVTMPDPAHSLNAERTFY